MSIQLVLILLQVLVVRFWPDNLGSESVERWAPIFVHGALLALMLWLEIIPILRWWFSTFSVTGVRLQLGLAQVL